MALRGVTRSQPGSSPEPRSSSFLSQAGAIAVTNPEAARNGGRGRGERYGGPIRHNRKSGGQSNVWVAVPGYADVANVWTMVKPLDV